MSQMPKSFIAIAATALLATVGYATAQTTESTVDAATNTVTTTNTSSRLAPGVIDISRASDVRDASASPSMVIVTTKRTTTTTVTPTLPSNVTGALTSDAIVLQAFPETPAYALLALAPIAAKTMPVAPVNVAVASSDVGLPGEPMLPPRADRH